MSRLIIIGLIAVLAIGCGSRTTNQETTQTGLEVSATERTDYESTTERRLAQVGARIDSLRAQLGAAGEKTKTEMQQDLAALEDERATAERKLGELRASGAEGWKNMKEDMANVLDALDRKIQQTSDRLRDGQN
ncbi:MAG TPA: hypothetical protein VEY91_00050 [Candidatus Limnocylindria bacterium]|nr:hypothetical protein [Candidatus Limnocylindria bacterium]